MKQDFEKRMEIEETLIESEKSSAIYLKRLRMELP
jgi:hypothetical protein